METEALLNFSCEMGRQLLQNGAEIYRVEESIRRLLAAYISYDSTHVMLLLFV